MALLGLLQKKSDPPPAAVADVAVEVIAKAPAPEGPPLLVLIPDITGISSFRLHRFDEAKAAASFIHERVRAEVRQGIHAFWALSRRPDPGLDGSDSSTGEALVLFRTRENSDLVYVVSFVDIESAQSFVRFEVRRGLHPQLAMIYWAGIVNVREELDGVSLIPSCPPAPARAQAAEEPVSVDLEGAPRQQAITTVEAEAEAAAVAYLHQVTGADLMVEESAPGAAPTLAEEPAEAEALNTLEVAAEEQDRGEETPEAGAVATAEAPAIAAGPVQTYAGDEELADKHLEVFSPVEGEPQMMDDAAAFMPATENSTAVPEIRSGSFDIEAEVERFLRMRRSERRDGPFEGFNSPPGRF